jgi:hypothetical protein
LLNQFNARAFNLRSVRLAPLIRGLSMSHQDVLVTAASIDDTLGLNLPRLFQEVGLVDPDIAFIHPVYLRGEQKRLWEFSFFEASPHIVRSGLTTEAELNRLSAALAAVAADETISVAQARMPAAWARKPS